MKNELIMSIVGIVCGALGYFVRSIIDLWKGKRGITTNHLFEDLNMQKELLVVFLGPIYDEFVILHQMGHTYDISWRKEITNHIYDWLINNKYKFPDEIRKTMVWFAYFAGTLVQEQTLMACQDSIHFDECNRRHDIIEIYFKEISNKLKGYK